MASVNKVILIGNLGRDPETRYTTGGDAVTNQAEIAGEYLKKGRPVYIEGRLQTRKWTDKEGVEKYSTEVVGDRLQLLGSRDGGGGGDAEFSGGGGSARREGGAAGAGASKPAGAAKKNVDDFDDDIPF